MYRDQRSATAEKERLSTGRLREREQGREPKANH